MCTTLFDFRRIFMSVGAKLQTFKNAEYWPTEIRIWRLLCSEKHFSVCFNHKVDNRSHIVS